MATSISDRSASTPRNSLDDVQGRPAKAVNERQSPVGQLIAEAVRRGEGSQKAAALTLGKDQGQFCRELKAGTTEVRELDAFSPKSLAGLGELLTERYGETDPKAQIRCVIRDVRTQLDELAAMVEDL